eukprot:TRINITY_DN909_c0_g2_i1.p1 TRINITY_DN909_c0_g2~~TRINITY_DN909_c0_g2_i1.p1  ORF type:complete len:300 (-),score=65.42 TRINITY_DN909_c0_g2_i1:141-1040(-)
MAYFRTLLLCCACLAFVAGGAVPTQPELSQVGASKGENLNKASADVKINWKAAGAEFVAMTLFVIIGCGSAMGIAKEPGSAWVLQVSLTFGLAITALAYTVGHYSGAQINCAVTFGLALSGHLSYLQAAVNFAAQMLGAVLGAVILLQMHLPEEDKTASIGCNGVGANSSQLTALVGEFCMTFLLMFVVLETAISPLSLENRSMAPLAIGVAVFLAHSVLIPIDGCSINPTRSFGPALVASLIRSPNVKDAWKDMWVFWVGPLLGSAAAVGAHAGLAHLAYHEMRKEMEEQMMRMAMGQ